MQGLIIPWSQVRVLVGLHFVRAGPHRTIPASAYATAFAAAQSDALPSQPLTEIVARVKHSETRDGTFNPGLPMKQYPRRELSNFYAGRTSPDCPDLRLRHAITPTWMAHSLAAAHRG